MMKLQSAIEYLTTYGWAILIISIALIVIFSLISSHPQSQECLLPSGFSCINYFMAQNGLLTLNFLQSTQYPIQLTAVGCNNPEAIGQMDSANQVDFAVPANIPIGSNYTASIQCFSNSTAFSGQINQYYSGYVVLNYTNAYTDFPNTIYGRINVKIIK